MRHGFALWVLLGASLSAPLRAEPATKAASALERAEQFFRKGTEAFEAERYSDAYGALLSAWALAPNYRTAAELGQVELRLLQYRDAALHLAYCLRNFPESGDAAARQHVEEGLAQAREHVAALRVRVDPEGADIAIDGQSVGHAPLDGLSFVSPGSHVVQASAPGRATQSETVDVPVRGSRDVSFSLSPSPTEGSSSEKAAVMPAPALASSPLSPSPVGTPTSSPATARFSNTVWTLIIGGSLTAVAASIGLVFEAKGNSAANDASDVHRAIGPDGDCRPSATAAPSALCARLKDAADERNGDDKIALVSAVTAGALGAATIGTAIFFEAKGSAASTPSAQAWMQIHPTPGGLAVVLEGVL